MEDDENVTEYIPLESICRNQGRFEIVNSLLSEYGVLGFEYGFSMASPNTLTVWEAQFGDFHNGAQTIIDQFIVAGESKWQRMNGLVIQLPHGYEGQGPEHSSARIERFLDLCAENNIVVANCTTPANFFHLLRRQMVRSFRKPAIVFTPKSMLRNPECQSSISELLGESKFQEILDDTRANVGQVTKVLFCSGKLYYDLLAYKKENKIEHTAIVRLEQLYQKFAIGIVWIVAKLLLFLFAEMLQSQNYVSIMKSQCKRCTKGNFCSSSRCAFGSKLGINYFKSALISKDTF